MRLVRTAPWAVAALLLGAMISIVPPASAAGVHVIGFSGLPAGTVVSSLLSDDGFGPVGVFGENPNFPGVNTAVVFDSSAPTGGDFDLGTPHGDFGGPGVGSGGCAACPFPNAAPLGNVLIIDEHMTDTSPADGLVDIPDDEGDKKKKTFFFDFSLGGTVTMESIVVIDLECEDPDDHVAMFGPGGLLGIVPLPCPGNNGVAVVPLGPTSGVSAVHVVIHQSGAIDELAFSANTTPFPVPELGALPLALVGLVGVGMVLWRRRA